MRTALNTVNHALAFAAAPAAAPAATTGKPGAPTGPRVAPVVSAAIKIDLPTRERKRGSTSMYPFDTLTEAGMAFGVKGKKAKNLSSVISNVNKKYIKQEIDENGNAVFETKKIAAPSGDGTFIDVPDSEKPKMIVERKFIAIDVDADVAKKLEKTALAGFECLIQRTI